MIFTCIRAFSQEVNNQNQDAMIDLGNLTAFAPVAIGKSQKNYDYIGSEFFSNSYSNGSLTLASNEMVIADLKIRYNIYQELLEVKRGDALFRVVNKQIKSFSISEQGKVSDFINYSELELTKNLDLGFIMVIYVGENVGLYSKLGKKRIEQDSSEPYSSSKSYIKYSDNNQYYILKNNELHEILSKKKLLENFPELSNYTGFSRKTLNKEYLLIEMVKFLDRN